MIRLNQEKINAGYFPDGTLLLKQQVPVDFTKERSFTIEWLFENNEEMITLIYLVKCMMIKIHRILQRLIQSKLQSN